MAKRKKVKRKTHKRKKVKRKKVRKRKIHHKRKKVPKIIPSKGRVKTKKKAKKIGRKKVKARHVVKQKLKYSRETVQVKRKCVKCKVPLSGVGYRVISKPLFGIKASKKKRGHCNKCD